MAGNHVLFVGWNRPVAGREVAATEHLATAVNYLTKQQTVGNIERFEPVLLDHHGGDLNGFILIHGERQKLMALTETDEWLDITVRAGILTTHLGVVRGYTGEVMRTRMALLARLAAR